MTEEKLVERYETPLDERVQPRKKTEKAERKAVRAGALVWSRVLRALGAGVLGFLFGGAAFPFGLYPLGCALVASMPGYTAPAILGILLRAVSLLPMTSDVLLSVICAAALLICRVLLNMAVFGQKNIARMKRLPDTAGMKVLLCAVFVLGISLVDAFYIGVTVQGMIHAALLTVSSIAFTLLFTFFFDEAYRNAPVFEAGLGALAYTLTFSLMPFSVGGFSVGQAAAFAITLFVGFLGVPTRSASVGLLCGLAAGGYFAPVLALSGLVVGIFAESAPLLGGLSAALVTACSALYFGTWETVSAFLPELLVSAFAVTALAMMKLLPTPDVFPGISRTEKENAAALVWSKRCDTEKEMRMRGLSGALASLAQMVQGLSERFRRPEPAKLSEKCRETWRSYCEKCPNECSCRGLSELESERVSAKLASRLMSSGRIDRERLYEITRVRCPHLDAIAQEISLVSARMLEDAIRDDKTRVFALDYEVMSQMFADAAAEGDMRMPVDKVLSDRLRRAFMRAGLRAENVLVCGDRKRTVIATGDEIAKTSLRPSDIRLICEGVCGMRFGKPSFMLESGKSAFMLETAPVYTVETVTRQIPKRGEFVCGDSVSSSVSHDDYYYCFVCDGMGSGEEAALTSKLCRVFLEKMLVCGNKKSTTLEMLNHLLCSRGAECFATVDLCEIDLVYGVASFLKSGAVPSFVMRAGHLYKISSVTFPIGILPQISAEVTDFELCEGDVIIMCSDGILSDPDASDGEDSARFLDLITREWTDELSLMAEKILTYSSDFSVRTDDMTVALIRIKKDGQHP